MEVQSTTPTIEAGSTVVEQEVTVHPQALLQSEQVQAVHRTQLKEFILRHKGSFISLDYVKLDGSERKLVGRLGVRKHLKGGENKVEALDRPYLTMWDVQNKGYRTVNLATVNGIRANHVNYAVIG